MPSGTEPCRAVRCRVVRAAPRRAAPCDAEPCRAVPWRAGHEACPPPSPLPPRSPPGPAVPRRPVCPGAERGAARRGRAACGQLARRPPPARPPADSSCLGGSLAVNRLPAAARRDPRRPAPCHGRPGPGPGCPGGVRTTRRRRSGAEHGVPRVHFPVPPPAVLLGAPEPGGRQYRLPPPSPLRSLCTRDGLLRLNFCPPSLPPSLLLIVPRQRTRSGGHHRQ